MTLFMYRCHGTLSISPRKDLFENKQGKYQYSITRKNNYHLPAVSSESCMRNLGFQRDKNDARLPFYSVTRQT